MKKIYLLIPVFILVLFLFFSASKDKADIKPLNTTCTDCWVEYENNPVIKMGDTIEGMVWNDASVIKEGDTYRMWLSGGKIDDLIVVHVYTATSSDGIDWDINPEPLIEPSESGWDSLRIETPSVIKVDQTYHLYYSGCDAPCNDGVYSIGHATSADGISWTKDPNNPVITFQDDPLHWGYYNAAEPGIVYNELDGLFYLYYVSAKSNYPNPGVGSGILLSTSEDGSIFNHYTDKDGNRLAVHTSEDTYDPERYRGYSTPMVYIDDGVFHMYHDLVFDPDGFHQVAIAYATSSDGKAFTEVGTEIFTYGNKDWKDYEVLAPTALIDENEIKIWFSGWTNIGGFQPGIGFASKSLE